MGIMSLEAWPPLVSTVLTFLDLVLILPRRRGSLRVPEECAKSFRAGLDGISKPFGHLALCLSSRLISLLRGGRLAIRRFLSRFTSFHVDMGGTPCRQYEFRSRFEGFERSRWSCMEIPAVW
ncbi:hypothetical protein EDC04DRAFT_1481746 [Pisolithus marmoratus]|nr:hypothetical protein EDC04DRAFT_1481746 [Pisolithus marmoratus]